LDDVLGVVDMGTPVEVNAQAAVDESEAKKWGLFKNKYE
jgi:hypothetical protein